MASIIGLALFASGTPSPLYETYRALWGFSPVVLTLVYATYAFGVLASLLLAGPVSDQAGRRTVLIVALAALMLATVVFIVANSLAWLFAARAIQGGRDRAGPRSGERRLARPSPAPRPQRGRAGQRGGQHRRDRARSAHLGVDHRVTARPQGASLRRGVCPIRSGVCWDAAHAQAGEVTVTPAPAPTAADRAGCRATS